MNFSVDFSVTEAGRRRPEYTLETDINGQISLLDFLQFTKNVLIVTADEVLKDAQAQGFDKSPIVAVDGTVGKPVINVSPFGSIEFTARADLKAVILETYQGIMLRSPVLEGRYQSSNFVFWNGTQVATDQASLTSWLGTDPDFKESDLIRFVNVQPYARKLERLGVTGQRQQSRTVARRKKNAAGGRVLVPNGTYFLTARAIRSKYKRNSVIKFTFISGSSLGISGSFKQARAGKPGRAYLYPSIVISVSESGSY